MSDVIIAGYDKAPALPRARLIFGLDATMSRQKTWDVAVEVQSQMFQATAPIGALNVQLAFYRADECPVTPWVSSGAELARLMRAIDCRAGNTQIGQILSHVRRETEKAPVQRLIFIGDAMEESLDELAGAASELGRLGVPIHMFQERRDPDVRAAFRLIALRSGGEFHEFNTATPQAIAQLAAKLSNVAKLAVQNAALLTHRK